MNGMGTAMQEPDDLGVEAGQVHLANGATVQHSTAQHHADHDARPWLLEQVERKAYRAGWWWGFSSGLICGTGSTALLGVLVYTVWQALACTQC